MVATIIATSGSTPASALSKMLVKEGGIVSVGTVGGGCMEGDVLLHANRLYEAKKAEILTFHLNEDDIQHGLICGGSLDVLIEPLTRSDIPLIENLKSLRDEGEDCVVATYLNSAGTISFKELLRPGNDPSDSNGLERVKSLLSSHNIAFRLDEEVNAVYHRNETRRLKLSEGELILEPIQGSPSLILFGGGHVSKYVCRAASMAGFRVTVIDDRPKYANAQRFPEAVKTLAMDFLESFDEVTINRASYIVIVTRGHRNDEEILERALATDARYIGMIGSKRKVLTTYEHLVARGMSAESLQRVHAPMGIEIGAVTAEEIAVSIVAEMIRIRRQSQAPVSHKSDVMSELIPKISNPIS